MTFRPLLPRWVFEMFSAVLLIGGFARDTCASETPPWSARVLEMLTQPEAKLPEEPLLLRHYAVAPGSTTALLPALRELLPAPWSVHASPQGDRLSVLAPERLHATLASLLEALGTPSSAAQSPDLAPLLEELKRSLAEQPSRFDSQQQTLLRELQQLREEDRRVVWFLTAGGGVLGLVLLGTLLMRRRSRVRATPVFELQPMTNELTRALLPETQRQTDDIKLALRDLGVHLQAAVEARGRQLTELHARLNEVEGRQRDGNEAGQAALTLAARSLEGTAERLTRENDRIEALAGELQGTLHELDVARDRLRGAEQALHERDAELTRRNNALEHERAKLAALTLILERVESDPPATRSPTTTRPPGGVGFLLLKPGT